MAERAVGRGQWVVDVIGGEGWVVGDVKGLADGVAWGNWEERCMDLAYSINKRLPARDKHPTQHRRWQAPSTSSTYPVP